MTHRSSSRSPSRRRWFPLVITAASVIAASCSSGSPTATLDAPTSPTPTAVTPIATDVRNDAATVTDPAVTPEGFDRVAARVSSADGTLCEICVWLAATDDQRSQGLMFVTDLGPANAMAFRYPSPHSGSFWMKNTVLALSIAFYAPTGEFLDAFDMEPCAGDPCPTYRTPSNFVIALEVPQGGLDELGMLPGSTFELLDLPCDDET